MKESFLVNEWFDKCHTELVEVLREQLRDTLFVSGFFSGSPPAKGELEGV
jgi:hypothetical protein